MGGNVSAARQARRPEIVDQRPKRGRSPLRAEMRALAISKRSICAMKRPNSEVEGVRRSEAVLDMVDPSGLAPGRRVRLRSNLRIPDATDQSFVCMAAKIFLQCKIE